jgi:peptidoglycan/xylan/chitin deacetylase (PgdA/CDA1 family)
MKNTDTARYFNIAKRMSKKLLFGKEEAGFITLLYHRIKEKDEAMDFLPTLINASPEEFEKEIKLLTKNFNVISINDALNNLKDNKPLPEKSMLVTFDDGYRDNYLNAFPVLKKYKVPAAIFLTSDLIDSDDLIWTDKIACMIDKIKGRSLAVPGLGVYTVINKKNKDKAKFAIIEYLKSIDDREKDKIINSMSMGWNTDSCCHAAERYYLSGKEILEMAENGITFGSHGFSHSVLTKIDAGRLEREIIESKARIEEVTGKRVELFAYPHGAHGDFNENIAYFLKKSGYKAAFTAVPGRNYISDKLDLFSLKRVSAGKSLMELRKNIFLYT